MQRLGTRRRDAPEVPIDTYARNPEIAQLVEAIAKGLDAVEQVEGPTRDVAFELLKAYAAQYALALFCEVGRLDSLIARLQIESRTDTD